MDANTLDSDNDTGKKLVNVVATINRQVENWYELDGVKLDTPTILTVFDKYGVKMIEWQRAGNETRFLLEVKIT